MSTPTSHTLDVNISTPMGNIDGKMTLHIDGKLDAAAKTRMGNLTICSK